MKRMDNLAETLKRDAERIDVNISPELERRIAATLEGLEALPRPQPAAAARPSSFWWASALAGLTAALVIVAVVNFRATNDGFVPAVNGVSPVAELPTVPMLDLNTETAVLTEPLQQELKALQSDLKKAEAKVKEDIGL